MTAEAGAAPAADVPAASSPAPAPSATPTAPTKGTPRQRMAEKLRQSRKAETEAPASANDAPTETLAGDAEKKPGESTAPQAGKDTEAKAEEPKGTEQESEQMVPLSALKERVGRANAKAEKLQGRVNELELQHRSTTEAMRLMQAEVERYRAALSEKQLLDPRDEQIRELQLQQEAQGIRSKLEKEHAEQLAQLRAEAEQAAAQEREEAQVEAQRQVLGRQLQAALDEFPLAHRAAVIHALRASPMSEPREVAKAIHEQAITTAQRLNAPQAPKPVAPQTVSSPSASPARRLPATPKNMAAHLKALRASTG